MKRINDFFADHGFSPYSLGMLVLLCEAIIGIVIVAWIKIVGMKDWRTSIVMGSLCVLIFIIDIIFGYICRCPACDRWQTLFWDRRRLPSKYCPKCGMDLTQPLFHVHYDVEPDDTDPEDGIRFNWRDDEQE